MAKNDECEYWPDVKPPVLTDRTNSRYYNLEYIQPVYRKRFAGMTRWFYLAICDCGNETIVYPWSAMSCGCRKTRGRGEPSNPDINKFDRRQHCLKFPFSCLHYMECLDELAFTCKITPSRFKLGCYTRTAEEESLWMNKE